MFPERHCFVAVLVTISKVSLTQLVAGIATKPWLSGNMFPNIKICENGWSNFSNNLRIVALKLLELTRLYHQIYQCKVIYFNFVGVGGPSWYKAIFRAKSIYIEAHVMYEYIIIRISICKMDRNGYYNKIDFFVWIYYNMDFNEMISFYLKT